MVDGLAVFVNWTNGLEFVVPALRLLMVFVGVFVPHQLFVAVTVVSSLSRLFATVAVFPARRLKCMVMGPAPESFPVAMPPPLPVAELPVIVTLVSVVESGDAGFR